MKRYIILCCCGVVHDVNSYDINLFSTNSKFMPPSKKIRGNATSLAYMYCFEVGYYEWNMINFLKINSSVLRNSVKWNRERFIARENLWWEWLGVNLTSSKPSVRWFLIKFTAAPHVVPTHTYAVHLMRPLLPWQRTLQDVILHFVC